MNDDSKQLKSVKNEKAVKFTGIILICIGVLFLLHTFVPGLRMGHLWPLFLLIPVFVLLSVLISNGKSAYGVIIPIVILTTYAVYFLIMNYAGWYWSQQTWPVFLLGPALGFYAFYLVSGEKGILIPAGILTVLAVIFFGAIYESANLIGICFVAAGIVILLSSIIRKRKQ